MTIIGSAFAQLCETRPRVEKRHSGALLATGKTGISEDCRGGSVRSTRARRGISGPSLALEDEKVAPAPGAPLASHFDRSALGREMVVLV